MASPRSTLVVSSVSIFVVGLLSGVLGPLIPGLAARLGVGVEALGTLFTALFLGALVTQFAGGWVNERVGLRPMVLVGTALFGLGALGLTVSPSLPLLLACACLAGAGQGTLDISTNVLVAAVYDQRRAVSAVNVLHFAFGAGAVLSPILAAYSQQRWGTPMPALWLAGLIALVNLAAGTRALLDPPVVKHEPGRAARGLYGRVELWALALLMFLYVGIEMGLGGWTTVYLDRTTALSVPAVAWVVSGYWLALTGGRLVGAFLGTRVSARTLIAVSLAGSLAGALLLAAGGGNLVLTVSGILLCGVAFGPVFPTVVVLATEIFRDSPSRAVSVVISLSSLGGMVLPPLQGLLLVKVSPLASVGQVALCALLMVVLLLVAERSARPAVARSAGAA